ncbi:hypothetical protein B0H67DRAFT_589231 [Lasiosphaeris hirsuta]|uniref:Phytanoyl-CoA dioxygenase n=1 Tax=Lasiosphaeris hirsuta TaxID=260670 RepID=A0AA40DNV6_9PEZI|nr:hypothetical protein B0H67DRAFT_589231 [Lasiosphaeris hirsuta]
MENRAFLADQLHDQGYVIVPSLLSAAELSTLRTAATALTSLARTGQWPYVRTVGKQFPPWPTPTPVSPPADIWGVQHLLHPSLPAPVQSAFAAVYFSPALLSIAKHLVTPHGSPPAADADLVLELLNLLTNPTATPFALTWHRDDIPASTAPADEAALLARPAWHTQYNLALFDGDDSLVVVPGSHRRVRTDAERAADPYAADMPGQVRVVLGAGDVVFYDNNILHRGVYGVERERMTVHGSVGHVRGSKGRARNVLQHGIGEWVGGCDFSGRGEGRERVEGMRARAVEMGTGRDVGFSLEG